MKTKRIALTFLRRIVVTVVIIVILLLSADKLTQYVGKILYPTEYSDYVEKYSAEYGVDKSLCYALIKCESGFDKNAESSAGAVGLMQLTPDTFGYICTKLYDYDVDAEYIYDPATNIKCGIWYLSYLSGMFGDTKTVIAAYNAGPAKVSYWLQNSEYSSDGKTLQNTPYPETENHIEKVLKARKYYNKLYNFDKE